MWDKSENETSLNTKLGPVENYDRLVTRARTDKFRQHGNTGRDKRSETCRVSTDGVSGDTGGRKQKSAHT